MASWLRAAEDLFEVVDRKAKLAVGEKSDELPVPTPGYMQPQKNISSSEAPLTVNIEKQQRIAETSQSHEEPDENKPLPLIENSESNQDIPSSKDDSDELHNADRDVSITETSLSETIPNEEVKPVGDQPDAEASSNAEAVASNLNSNLRVEEFADIPAGSPSNAAKVVETLNSDSQVESNQNMISQDGGASESFELAESETQHANTPSKIDAKSKDVDIVTAPGIQTKKPQETKNDTPAKKVEEQLDEAQGLLKSAISTGQSKEARLARVCAGLSSRLQEYKSENAQLEELLVAERELSKSYEDRIKHLQKDLSASKGEVSRVESNMLEALAAKNSEIETLASSVDALKKQAAFSEGNLASLQANMESIMRNRELTETRMMQALREELTAAERRSEEERAAHNSTKLAFREREVELEQRAIEASTALARIQRTADDRAAKAAELEQKVALLEVECASLNQELQDMEARVRRGQKKAPEDASQAIQVQAWQEEVERARHGQRDAEGKLSSMEASRTVQKYFTSYSQAEVQKMRVEMAAMKRDAEHYSRQNIFEWSQVVNCLCFEQEHTELEKRYRELTDLLYYKQTQLETMASEKAAAEFQLEKEVKLLKEAQLEAERNRSSRRASSSWEEDTDMKALEPLPLHHRHMVGAGLQLQKAAKILDTGAVRATRFLWRYPTARIILLFYLVRKLS
ncbi:hypothetical protein RD792_014640 [Penstemon davidsonii]|uniref:Golgin-84 n=1 Tax=Penstemon davidsonii TaxID=160366 RepID=A0ABR0CQR6_9LAMI|nr:hypothetical protein RD792_014640 [Penstemon davidsonii]